jgi:hypothetical protein
MKRLLAIGVILLFLGMSISSTGLIAEQQTTIPDFRIVDVEIKYYLCGWPQFLIYIENIGQDVSWNGECRYTFKKLFRDENVYSKTVDWDSNKYHSNGEIKSVDTLEINVEKIPNFFIGRIFFKVNPNGIIDESNEHNNMVWAFIYLHWSQWLQWSIRTNIIIGRLRSPK